MTQDGELLGRYRLLRRVGSGGMGEVYLAAAAGPGGVERQVAIKVVRPSGDGTDALREMFLEEAKLSFLLSHPNIVQTFDVGEVEGQQFIVLEYVDGVTLARLMSRQTMSRELALYIGAQAARGLAYAHGLRGDDGHALGVVHRDVSPSNLLVSRRGHVKLVDFGLATSTLRELRSEAGVVKGKVAYMSPEQLQGKALEGRSDVYSLGVMLFEMIARAHPFGDPLELSYVGRLDGGPAPGLESMCEVEPALAAVVNRCLSDEIEWRPRADEVRRELDALLAERGPIDAEGQLGELVQAASAARPQNNPFDRALGIELARVEGEGGTQFSVVGGHLPTSEELRRELGEQSTPPARDASDTADIAATPTRIETPRGQRPDRQPPRSPAPMVLGAVLVVMLVGAGMWALWGPPRGGASNVVQPPDATVDSVVVSPGAGSAAAGSGSAAEPKAKRGTRGATKQATLAVHPVPPGGRVFIDGKLRGTAPLTLAGLSPGALEVRIVTAGRRTYHERITLEPGASLTLEPRLLRAAPRHVRAKPTGTLSVNSEPWSIVYVDGRRLRGTPLVKHRLVVGRHRVRLVNPPRKLSTTRRVTIRAGRDTALVVTRW